MGLSVAGTILERKKGPEAFPPESVGLLELSEVMDLYKSVGRRNIEYLAWIHDVYSWITLPSVSFDWKRALGEDKTKLTIFDILADDLADNHTTRSYSLLKELTEIPWSAEAKTAAT